MADVLVAVNIDVTSIGQIPRLLKKAGCRVSLIARKGLAVQRSRYVDRHIQWPRGAGSLVEALRIHLDQVEQPYRWVVIGDESLLWELVDEGDKSWMEGWFPFSLDSAESANSYSNLALMKDAARTGYTVPPFCISNDIDEARSGAIDVGYPVVLKADRGASSSGVRSAQNEDDLARGWQEMFDGQPLMVQKMVEGDVGETSILLDHGKPLCWFSMYCRKPWPNSFAASSERQLMAHRDIERLVYGIGDLTRFNGLCGIDWIHDLEKDLMTIIEFNPRPTPGVYLSDRMDTGVSMDRAIKGWLSGDPHVQRPHKNLTGKVTVPVFPQGLFRAMADRRPLDFLRSFGAAPWDDPLLLAAQLRRFASHYLPARWKTAARRLIRPRRSPRARRARA